MSKYAPSVLSSEKKCFITGRTDNLHRHEIFFGSGQRKISIENGLWVYLTGEKHNQSNNGVHFDRELDLHLKQTAQAKYESIFGRSEFLKLFRKNWL